MPPARRPEVPRFPSVRRAAAIALAGLLGISGAGPLAGPAGAQTTRTGSIVVGGRTRDFRIRVPAGLSPARPVPLVVVFHGGGGNGRSMERLTGFDVIADREHVLVVYPNGMGGNWNDGREAPDLQTQRDSVDDVAFIGDLLDTLAARYPVDARRVYATGISNGGIFSHTLGLRLATRLAAIAPVAGGIAEPLAAAFHPDAPVSVLIVHGTDDPLVPFNGGNVARGGRGRVIPTDSAVARWRAADDIEGEVLHELIRGSGRRGCDTRRTIWSGGRAGTVVELDLVVGGGHAWPGGRQYAPRLLIGKACGPPDATELIWRFFAAHPKE